MSKVAQLRRGTAQQQSLSYYFFVDDQEKKWGGCSSGSINHRSRVSAYKGFRKVFNHTSGDGRFLPHPAQGPALSPQPGPLPGLTFNFPLKLGTLLNKVKPVSLPVLIPLPHSYHKKPFQKTPSDTSPPATPRGSEIRLKHPIQ